MAESIHKGHRERLKERFLKEGLDNFTDIQALELLLFYAIPQRDTNPIAHELLSRFGSLSQVLEAEAESLKTVPYIGDNAATLLRLVTELTPPAALKAPVWIGGAPVMEISRIVIHGARDETPSVEIVKEG